MNPGPEFQHNQLVRSIKEAKKQCNDNIEILEKKIKELEKQLNQLVLRVGTIESSNGR